MAKVFLSYSHADETLRNKLESHLAMLKRSGEIDIWHDRMLVVGDHLDGEISEYLETADLIVFLVSSDFLASYYCYDREMTRAMERVKEGTARVAPIVARACDWKSAPFAQYVLAPTDAKPIVEHPDIDAALLAVVGELRRAIGKLSEKKPKAGDMALASSTLAVKEDRVEFPRSSNLRVTKSFSDADKARFRDEAFSFIEKFFANSLGELAERNAEIETRFKTISAEEFVCEVFRDGKHVSACKIFVARMFGGRVGEIAYSSSIDSSKNSMNASLSVENDDQMMFLRPMMFISSIGRDDIKLSFHGGAELLWEQLIGPLQRGR